MGNYFTSWRDLPTVPILNSLSSSTNLIEPNWIDALYYAGGSSKYYTMIFGMSKKTKQE